MVQFVETFIILFIALSLASLGSLFSEKAGIANISIEGNMVIGAITYLVMMSDKVGLYSACGFIAPFIALIIAIIVTCLFSILFGIATITFGTDQIVIGTGMNLIAPAISIICCYVFFEKSSADIPNYTFLLGQEKFNGYAIIFLFLAILIIASCFLIFKYFRFGLRLTSIGENPYSFEVSGNSVYKYQYFALLITGALSAVAGVVLTFNMNTFYGTVFGMGFLAIGIVIFGQWKVLNITLGAFLISFVFTFAVNWTFLFPNTNVPEEFIKMIPFVLPIVVLIFFKNVEGPQNIGQSFRKDER